MRAVDTNILVRLITGDPKQFGAAKSFVERGVWVSNVVLAETVWVLSAVYDLGSEDVATAVAMLLDHEHVSLQDAEVVDAALQRFRDSPSVEFTDCLVLEIARKAGHLPLGTFDRRLSKIDGAERV